MTFIRGLLTVFVLPWLLILYLFTREFAAGGFGGDAYRSVRR
jgi:hypothetical protein